MKTTILCLVLSLTISSITDAFCPFEDRFIIGKNDNNPAIKFLSSSTYPFDNNFTNTLSDGLFTIKSNATCSNLSDWNSITIQVKLGEDNDNYCEVDVRDGALMSAAEEARVNCIGHLNTKVIALNHTPSTNQYTFSIYDRKT